MAKMKSCKGKSIRSLGWLTGRVIRMARDRVVRMAKRWGCLDSQEVGSLGWQRGRVVRSAEVGSFGQ